MPVEALLGMDMAHPNVVQTYRHTSLNSMVCFLLDCLAAANFALDLLSRVMLCLVLHSTLVTVSSTLGMADTFVSTHLYWSYLGRETGGPMLCRSSSATNVCRCAIQHALCPCDASCVMLCLCSLLQHCVISSFTAQNHYHTQSVLFSASIASGSQDTRTLPWHPWPGKRLLCSTSHALDIFQSAVLTCKLSA